VAFLALGFMTKLDEPSEFCMENVRHVPNKTVFFVKNY
jgi:hypothetical protein